LKKVYKYLMMLSICLIGFFISACEYKPTSLGLQHEVFVFADSLLWLDVKDEVEETFNSVIHTPRVENSFYLTWKPLTQLNNLKRRKNLFFIGTTAPGEVNEYLKQSIPQQFTQDVIDDKSFYFFKDDLFSHGQFSLFMIGRDLSSFQNKVSSLSENPIL